MIQLVSTQQMVCVVPGQMGVLLGQGLVAVPAMVVEAVNATRRNMCFALAWEQRGKDRAICPPL